MCFKGEYKYHTAYRKGGCMKHLDDQNLGKFLSLILRHKPEIINLQLDLHGWADVQELITKVNQSGTYLDFETLERIVITNNKQRYAFDEKKQKIRANQGHSIKVDLELTPVTPPKILYHGTAKRFLASIKEKGILKGSRQYVHLSADIETARKVGQRHGQAIILPLDIAQLQKINQPFYLSKNKVWLTNDIPSQYILWDQLIE